MRQARPLLLLLDADACGGPPSAADEDGSDGRVRVVRATCTGPWLLPVVGEVPAPASVLIRPDGHVLWVGRADDPALARVISTWFGCEPQQPSHCAG